MIIHTKEREILAPQLSRIVHIQAPTQVVITSRVLCVHERIKLAWTPLVHLPDHIHLDEQAGGNTSAIFTDYHLMWRFNGFNGFGAITMAQAACGLKEQRSRKRA